MPLLSKPSFGPRASLMYVTLGSLICVWTVVYYAAFVSGGAMTNKTWFWVVGLFLTGLTLLAVGLLIGQLGRAARRAELPPEDVTQIEAQVRTAEAAAAHPAAVDAHGNLIPTQPPAAPQPAPPPPSTGSYATAR